MPPCQAVSSIRPSAIRPTSPRVSGVTRQVVELQVLAEARTYTSFAETERAVAGGADLVVWLRIRRKLTTALRASPLFRRGDQRPADTLAASLRHDEPSLEVGHAVAAAALGVRANGELRETDRTSCVVLGEKHGERLPRFAGEELGDVVAVLGVGTLGPERATQLQPSCRVASRCGSNGVPHDVL